MPEAVPLEPGDPRRIGRYRLTSRLTAGIDHGPGAAKVFLASAPDGGRVAITLLGTDRAVGPAAQDRFTAEARTARQVVPVCMARILDAGLEGAQPYLVCEFVPGPSLAEVAAHEGPLGPDTIIPLAIGTATGLTAVHQAGLVHGHFGPRHVVFGPDGPRVVHGGITPPYGAATPAADMLAWARTLLFAATGRPPIGPQDLAALPAVLAEVVAPCLDPVPAGRPAAGDALAGLLGDGDFPDGPLAEGSRRARAAAREPLDAPGPRARIRHQTRGRTIAWAVGGTAVIAAAAAAGVYLESAAGGTSASSAAAHGTPHADRSSTVTVPAALAGTWSGTVHQTHPALTVTVRIVLTPGSATGTVDYPALGCSGKLAVASRSGTTLTATQTIAVGGGKCDNGVITLVLRGQGTLQFTFRRPAGVSPQGTLTRRP